MRACTCTCTRTFPQSIASSGKGDGEEEEEEEFNLWEAYKDQYKEAILPELEDGADNVW